MSGVWLAGAVRRIGWLRYLFGYRVSEPVGTIGGARRVTLDPDPDDPGWAFADCPACGFTTRIRWPPSNPETVEIRCHGCEGWHEVNRDGEVVNDE